MSRPVVVGESQVIKVSVIVPTYNRRQLIERTIPTLLDQDMPPDEYEVVVVVDGSRDNTAQYLKSLRPACDLKALEQPVNRGPGPAKNAGLAAARGKIVLFLDDDLLCERTLLSEHLQAHEAGGRCLAVGSVIVDPSLLPKFLNRVWTDSYDEWIERMASEPAGSWPIDLPIGTNISAPRDELVSAGGFDDGLARMHEDLDLALRLRRRGVELRFLPRAKVCHVYVKRPTDLVRDAEWQGRNSILLTRKHPGMRPYLCHSRLCEGSLLKRNARALSARMPFSPDPLLDILFRICTRLGSNDLFARLGVKLLAARMGIAAVRGGTRELGSWKEMRRQFGIQASMLVYHHVGPTGPGKYYPGLSVNADCFERQIAGLVRRGFQSILPSDWHAWLFEGKQLPDKPIFIAFDDAQADIATYALPVLRRYRFKALINVVTRRIGESSDWDTERGLTARPLMSADQILEWKGHGFEVGSHSRTHPDLTLLSDAELEDEIAGSRDDLERLLCSKIFSFSCPYYSSNNRVAELAGKHYPFVFGSLEGGLNSMSLERNRLRRTVVKDSDSIFYLWCRAYFGWSPVEAIAARLTDSPELLANISTPRAGAVRNTGIN